MRAAAHRCYARGMGGTLNRRDFLRTSAFAAGLAGLARLQPALGAEAPAPEVPDLHVLSTDEADILSAIAERMVHSGDASMPGFRDTDAIAVIDRSLRHADPALREQLGWLLWLFDWGPPVLALRMGRFRSLEPTQQDEYIRGWAESRFELRRLGFRALKNVSMLGYYTQDRTWAGIGYDGPWIKGEGARS